MSRCSCEAALGLASGVVEDISLPLQIAKTFHGAPAPFGEPALGLAFVSFTRIAHHGGAP